MQIKLPYQLSIEDTAGHSFMDGYHLGTDVQQALDLVAECFDNRVKHGQPVVTTALKDGKGKLLAVYDGDWHNVSQHVREGLAADRRGVFFDRVKGIVA